MFFDIIGVKLKNMHVHIGRVSSMDDKEMVVNEEVGSIKIADDVVSIIASLAASEVKGVAGMSGGIAGDIVEMLGKKNLSKGVKVEIKDNDVTIDLYIIVEYGCRIPEVAWEIQEKVKKAVETMTGLNVVKVNIHVQGVYIPKESKKDVVQEEDGSTKG